MLSPPQRDLVLLGGGHSHTLALRLLAMEMPAGLRVTLVSEADTSFYSGMLPGLLAGHYQCSDVQVDLRRLCSLLGVRFLRARGCGIDPGRQRVLLEDRPPLDYDYLSVNVGSRSSFSGVDGPADHAIPVKPLAGFYQHWQALLNSRAGGRLKGMRLVVVGGGAGSVELVLAIAHRLAGENISLQLICGLGLLEGYNPAARAVVRRCLRLARVELRESTRITALDATRLHTDGGAEIPCDRLFWCTQAGPVAWLADSALSTDENGFLLTEDNLLVTGFDNVFGVGDSAVQANHPRPRAGVYAVRQAPVLAENIRRLHRGMNTVDYRPQRRFLSLLALGGKRAVASRGWFCVGGAWVWRWKNSIDSRFMKQFRELPGMAVRARDDEDQPMYCGGCGAKLPASLLHSVLDELVRAFPDSVDQQALRDDAAALQHPPGKQLWQSTDSLRELVSDPWLMGRIAALHALSDIYAMGGRPLSCLAHICLPHGSASTMGSDMRQLMLGAMLEMDRAGCRLLGGHSIEGAELSVGFTVNGATDAGCALGKSGLQAGDRLLLTQPLGTGVVFAAQAAGRAPATSVAVALDNMLQSNAAAAQLALDYRVSACTDITGFGLLGHLLEMLAGADQLQARLELSALPLLDGAIDLFRAGFAGTLHPGNRAAAIADVAIDADCCPVHGMALYDPQTSGGLLLSVAPERSAALLTALQREGYAAASIIGEVCERAAQTRRVWLRS